MKLGVISDTHDQVENILKMVKILNDQKVELVFHCGDWVAPFTLRFYQDLQCPIRSVFGNNDGDKFRHLQFARAMELDITYEERFLKTEVGGRKIAMFHGDYDEIVAALVKCGEYDAVFHGHTHSRENVTIGKTLSLNPGTLMPVTDEKTKGASFAIYSTETNTALFVEL